MSDQFNRPIGVKKSQFLGKTTTPDDSATFDYVYQGMNIKIPYSDFLAGLGVTGTIVQGGDPLQYPVLDPQGSVNVIRNLEAGFGISIAVSPLNGLELSTAFSFDETGAVLVDDPESPTPLFRSLVAGAGIAIGASAGQIQISASEVPLSTKTITVSKETDFGTPVDGVYILESDTDYFLINDIVTANRFAASGNIQFRGSGDVITSLTYTGIDAMFTIVNCNMRMFNLTMSCIGSPSSTWLSVDDDGSGSFAGERISVFCSGLGEINDLGFFAFSTAAFNVVDAAGTGFTFTGLNGGIFNLTNSFLFNMSGGKIFDLGSAVFDKFDLQNSTLFNMEPAATFISGLADSGNISDVGSGGIGVVRDTQITGSIIELDGIDVDDDRWSFTGNNTIRDTRRDAIITTQDNTLLTPMPVLGVPAKMVAVFTELRTSGYSSDSTGTITSTQTKDDVVPVTISISGRMDDENDKDCVFYIAKGIAPLTSADIIDDISIEVSLHQTKTFSATLVWQGVVAVGESMELWGAQTEGPADAILLVDASFRVD